MKKMLAIALIASMLLTAMPIATMLIAMPFAAMPTALAESRKNKVTPAEKAALGELASWMDLRDALGDALDDPPAAKRSAKEKSTAERTFCCAVSADGNRFLLDTSVGKDAFGVRQQLFVLDRPTGQRTALSFAQNEIADAFVEHFVGSRSGDGLAQQVDALGGKPAFALQYMWATAPLAVACSGDWALVYSGLHFDYALINLLSGELTPLTGRSVSLSADGRAVICNPEGVAIFDPRDGSLTSLALEGDDRYLPLCAQLLSDGTLLCVRRDIKLYLREKTGFHYAFFDRDGKAVETIPGLVAQFNWAPDTLFYSEATGIGLAYSRQAQRAVGLQILRRDSKTIGTLLLDSQDATALIEQPLPKDTASLPHPSKVLLPLGLSQDGKTALLIQLRYDALSWVDLQTLQVRTTLNNDALKGLYKQGPVAFTGGGALFSLGWNGGAYLCGYGCPPHSVLALAGK